MQVMLLFPRDYPFLTEPLSVLSRYWFWQLRNCPVPNSVGRPSILVPKSLVSSSFREVTALRTGEELLMRGSKARLGDLLWWDQKQTNVKSAKNRDTWSFCKFCLERATYLWKWTQSEGKSDKYIFEVTESWVFWCRVPTLSTGRGR